MVIYDKTLNCDYCIRKIFEIKPNIIVLFSMEKAKSGCCVFGYYYSISLYNIQNGEKNINPKIFRYDDDNNDNEKPFLKIDNHLIAKYADCLDIYDIEQNMKLINEDDYEIIKTRSWYLDEENRKLKYEAPFKLFKEELKNNFILATTNDGESFVYKYENKSFKICQKFPFDLEDENIIKLKNGKLITYNRGEIKVINTFY